MNKYTSDLKNKKNYTGPANYNTGMDDNFFINNINKNNIILNFSDIIFQKKNNSVRNIGLIVDNLHDLDNSEIWIGIKDAADNYKGNLISFMTGNLYNPYCLKFLTSDVNKFIKSKCIDGIIFLYNKLNSYNRKYYKQFLKSLKTVPVIDIGGLFINNSRTMIDLESKIQDRLSYIINVHKCKKIAFICGPEENLATKNSLKIYKDVLKKHNILFDSNLVVYGRPDPGFGEKAVKILLDDRKINFDALIGSNDDVVNYAVKVLKERSVNVPCVAVSDEISEIYKDINIPKNFTEINSKIYQRGYNSVKMLYSAFDGNDDSNRKKSPDHLYAGSYRVGSINEEKYDLSKLQPSLNNNFEELQSDCRLYLLIKKMKLEFGNVISESIIHNWSKRLFFFLIEEVNGKAVGKFLDNLEQILAESKCYRIPIQLWNKIISFLFNKIIPKIKLSKYNSSIIYLMRDSFETINKAVIKKIEYSFKKNNNYIVTFNLLKRRLHKTFSLKRLKKNIYMYFSDIGIKSCYISLMNNKFDNKSKDFIAYKDFKILDLRKNNSQLSFKDVFKNINKNKNPYLIYSLSYKNKIFGRVILEIVNDEIQEYRYIQSKFIIYESLIMELSDCIRRMIVYYKKKIKTKFKINEKKCTKIESKYKKINLSKNEAENYYHQLLDCMEKEKPYLNPELTPDHLAEKINISFHNLSYIINVYSNVNFYDFVNSYRVERAKQYLLDIKINAVNILDVAYDSGFNSKSTFYRVFKDSTQMTPLQYMKKNKNKPV